MRVNRQLIVDQIPSLRRYARALTGNSWAADDLVQDTLERACRKWRLWIVGSDLRAWLFTVMHNVYANQVRKATQQNQSFVFDVDDVAHELVAPSSTGATLDLQRCLARLPDDQRAVLLLVGVEEMSYAEVAKILAIPIGHRDVTLIPRPPPIAGDDGCTGCQSFSLAAQRTHLEKHTDASTPEISQ